MGFLRVTKQANNHQWRRNMPDLHPYSNQQDDDV